MSGTNYQSRKWQLTINNFNDLGLDVQTVKDKLFLMNLNYWCLDQEVGHQNGTLHMHVFLYSTSAIRFNTIQRKFQGAHIESCRGSCKENRDYILKQGKFAGTEKADTVIAGTFEEWGEIPPNDEELEKTSRERVVDMITNGKSNKEIIYELPSEIYHIDEFNDIRQQILFEEYKKKPRPLDVTYIYGKSGTGKTSYVLRKYGFENVCRITSYFNSIRFDDYVGQEVILFEEFDSQIPLKDMLNYLDIYPLVLPARYHNRIACYTKAFITSNEPLEAQYKNEQETIPESFEALKRRINRIWEFKKLGEKPIKHKNEDSPKVDNYEYGKENESENEESY